VREREWWWWWWWKSTS